MSSYKLTPGAAVVAVDPITSWHAWGFPRYSPLIISHWERVGPVESWKCFFFCVIRLYYVRKTSSSNYTWIIGPTSCCVIWLSSRCSTSSSRTWPRSRSWSCCRWWFHCGSSRFWALCRFNLFQRWELKIWLSEKNLYFKNYDMNDPLHMLGKDSLKDSFCSRGNHRCSRIDRWNNLPCNWRPQDPSYFLVIFHQYKLMRFSLTVISFWSSWVR